MTNNQIKPPWHQRLSRSLHLSRSKPESRYVQLATVNKQNQPENRTVVFRGFDEGGERFIFITDTRSEKYASLQDKPKAEVCWYFSASREQFRLRGECAITVSGAERGSAWRGLSASGKQQFFWGQPGQPLSDSGSFTEPTGEQPPEQFALVYLKVTRVDYLNLKLSTQNIPQTRERYYIKDDRWCCDALVP